MIARFFAFVITFVAVCLLCAPVYSEPCPGSSQSEAAVGRPLGDPRLECPDLDFSALEWVQRGFAIERAASLHAVAPSDPETAEALLDAIDARGAGDPRSPAGRVARREALEAVHQVVLARPEAAVRLVRALLRYGLSLGENEQTAMRAIAVAARGNLAKLPVDQAAALDYELHRVERWLEERAPARSLTPPEDVLRGLVQHYPGTGTALRAELELLRCEEAPTEAASIERYDAFVAAHPGTCAAARGLAAKVAALRPEVRGARAGALAARAR